ncbi:MAG: hypothetical protein HOI58_10700 [Kordiimonadaceae bacterium]|nr:hypothetical protein [Kordiimonadaceae bacterium]
MVCHFSASAENYFGVMASIPFSRIILRIGQSFLTARRILSVLSSLRKKLSPTTVTPDKKFWFNMKFETG